jgi:hypothetical protein
MSPRAAAGPYPAQAADEIVLVLAAEGIAATLEPVQGGVMILIDDADAPGAERILADEYPAGIAAAAATRAAEQAAARARLVRPEADRWFGPGSWVLFALTAVCVGVFLAEEQAGGSEVREVLLRFGASRPAHVRTGEWWSTSDPGTCSATWPPCWCSVPRSSPRSDPGASWWCTCWPASPGTRSATR